MTDLYYRLRIYGIRTNGVTPCHRCLISKNDLAKLGAPSDTERDVCKRVGPEERSNIASAREFISNGYAVKSNPVEDLLKRQSLVPVQVRSLCSPHSPSTLGSSGI